MSLAKTKCWIEAMRLRTLPVSTAGVVAATAITLKSGCFKWAPSLICLCFAILAQIASNFANEYFDFRYGLDRPGREGPRRGVTEGDITPRAMLTATIATLGVAAALGCTLIVWGGWWLLLFGILIVTGALAYSAGPWPLSHHGLGEVAVILFFGIAPVTLTYWIQAHTLTAEVWRVAMAMGLMGANVLIVNNYRDADDDRAVGKRTLAVRLGRKPMALVYLLDWIVAVLLLWESFAVQLLPLAFLFLVLSYPLYRMLVGRRGAALTPLLGITSVVMFAVALTLLAGALFFPTTQLI